MEQPVGVTVSSREEMATSESILRARLVDAFNRLADAKELHRDVLPQALGLVGWAMTKATQLQCARANKESSALF